MKKRFVRIAIVGFGVLSLPALPFLLPTFDATQAINMGKTILQEAQMISAMQSQLQTIKTSLQYLPQNVKSRFVGFSQQFYRPQTGNVFGETASWTNAASSANGQNSAWQQAVTRLHTNSGFYQGQQVGNSADLSRLAGIEISDGAGPVAMQTVGSIRASQTQNQNALQQLQNTCFSDANNTPVMQANCAVGVGILETQSLQQANALSTIQAEQAVIQNLRQRNQDAKDLNFRNDVATWVQTEPTEVRMSAAKMQEYRPNW
jgi:hypothetical protein